MIEYTRNVVATTKSAVKMEQTLSAASGYFCLEHVPFPIKLHLMLSEIDRTSIHSDIVSWRPHGKLFVVHDRQRFIKEVLPWYVVQVLPRLKLLHSQLATCRVLDCCIASQLELQHYLLCVFSAATEHVRLQEDVEGA
jgi:HSF-type DNA-binding